MTNSNASFGLISEKSLNVPTQAQNKTLKLPLKEDAKKQVSEQTATYFNSDALWKRNLKSIGRSRDSYIKICRNKWRMFERPKSKFFVSDSPIQVIAPEFNQ